MSHKNVTLKKGKKHTDGPRYRVMEGSKSNHCCFEATVVDTECPDLIGGVQYYCRQERFLHYSTVAETFSVEQAVMVAEALNLKDTYDNQTEKGIL